MAGSFAQLARAADKARDTMLVPKEPLETPPLEIRTLGADELRQSARRIGKVNDEIRELARNMLRSMYTCLLYTSPSPRDKRQSRMPSSA